MSSHLRYSMSRNIEASSVIRPSSPPSPAKKQKMSLTQSFYLAHSARRLLAKEAAKADHDLRRLVGHANLLDGLMIDIADAEREQESWFNQSVTGAVTAEASPRTVQWADSIPETVVEDGSDDEGAWDEGDSSDEDLDDEEVELAKTISLRRRTSSTTATTTTITEVADEDIEVDDEDDADHALVRTPSASPPELMHEDSDSSEDESMPPSPPALKTPIHAFSEKERQAIATTSFYEPQASLAPSGPESFFNEDYYLPARQSSVVVVASA